MVEGELVESPGVAIMQSSDVSIDNLMARAIDGGANIDVLERLMVLRDKLKAEAAKAAFDAAMAAFQAECPVIRKTKDVHTKDKPDGSQGSKAYSFAPLESIVSQVKPLLQKYGFSYNFRSITDKEKQQITAICIVHHTDGHEQESPVQVPYGNKTPVMSDSQVAMAAMTFAKRYAFCNAFGIMTGDEDNEVLLQEKAVLTAAITDWKEKVEGSETIDELKTVYLNMPALAKKELKEVIDEKKRSFTKGA